MPLLAARSLYEAAAGGITVTVDLTGVAADPQIGTGTVEIEITIVHGVTEPIRFRRAKPRPKPDVFIYVYGVEARPRIGDFLTPAEVRLPAVMASPAIGELTTSASAAVDGISANAATSSLIAVTDSPMIGVQSDAEVGAGTVKTIIALFPEEILALLEAA